MLNKATKVAFVDFLKENNVYERYQKFIDEGEASDSFDEELDKLIKCTKNPKHLVSASFI